MSTDHSFESTSLIVGRDRELGLLRRDFAQSADKPVLALIEGEAGAGKTTLAETFLDEVASTGALTLIGRAYDLSETAPYGPWIELFACSGGRPEGTLEGVNFDQASNQAALFAQVRDFLDEAGTHRRVVLLLEDLQWADQASLDLLRFLSRAGNPLPLFGILTFRGDEISRRHPLTRMLANLTREARINRIALRPLGIDALRLLVETKYQLGGAEASRLAGYLERRAEGNAFYTTVLLRALEEVDALRREDGRWKLGELERLGVPRTLRQVIDARLLQLDENSQALLELAAATGQETSIEFWTAIAGSRDSDLNRALEFASQARLVELSPDGATFHFVHALIRESIYDGTFPIRRRQLHRQIAEVLLSMQNPDPDLVAYHLRQAGDTRAVDWLITAGNRAERAFALTTAIERYEAALALLDRANADPRTRSWLALKLAFLERFQEGGHVLPHLDRADLDAREAGDEFLAAQVQMVRGVVHCHTGMFQQGLDEMASSVGLQEALCRDADRPDQDESSFSSFLGRGMYAVWLAAAGKFEEARVQAERVIAIAEESPANPSSAANVAGAWSALSFARAMLGEVAGAQQADRRAFEAEQDAVKHQMFVASLKDEYGAAMLQYVIEDAELCDRLVAEGEETAKRLVGAKPFDDITTITRFPALWLLYIRGQWFEAEKIAEAISAGYESVVLANTRAAVLAAINKARGDHDRAWELVREVWPDGPVDQPYARYLSFAMPLQRLAAAIAIAENDLDTARRWIEANDEWLKWTGAFLGRANTKSLWSRWHQHSGDIPRAMHAAREAFAIASEPRQPFALIDVHRLMGELAAAEGEATAAREHFDASLKLAEACRAPFERAQTIVSLAELYVSTKSYDLAGDVLARASEICVPLAASPTLARVEAIRARLTSVAETELDQPGGLSTREAEVLKLLAQGLSNQQIADELFLSVRTVERHLTNAYGKIGASSRTSATAYALQNLA